MTQVSRTDGESPPALRVTSAIVSERGDHAVNEDAAATAVSGRYTLLAVADGLGAHAGAARASRLAIERAIADFERRPSLAADALEAVCEGAHRALVEATPAHHDNDLRSTLVVLIADGVRARWAHVGDSRAYRVLRGRILTRTRDHSVPEMLHRAGDIAEDEIRHHPDRSRLLQTLGQGAALKPAVSDAWPLASGDAFLLCSDGWWEQVGEAEMEATLRGAATPDVWLARMRGLIESRAPHDDYSAVAAFVV